MHLTHPRMKISQLLAYLRGRHRETLATFGGARLIKEADGKIRLLGGSRDDRAAAREWSSLFMHEVVVPM